MKKIEQYTLDKIKEDPEYWKAVYGDQDPILRRVLTAFRQSGHYQYMYIGGVYHEFDEALAEWLSILSPMELECEFNSHEILDLLQEAQ